MMKNQILGLFLGAILLVLGLPAVALAQEEQPEKPAVTDNITLSTDFPRLDGTATDTFTYTVELAYKGEKDRVFDLSTETPEGWRAYVTPQYDTQRISSISIEKSVVTTTKNLKVTVNGPSWPLAEPGEYKITFVVSSGELKGSIDLFAKVIPKGALSATPTNPSGLYNTKATAGKDNLFGIEVTNVGASTIESVTFSVNDKPEGWEITFKPEKLELLKVLEPTKVDISIRPSPNTMAGDYMFSVRVTGKDVNDPVKMDIRVTVLNPTIWGWVGVAIIVVVILALFAIFMRFGRR